MKWKCIALDLDRTTLRDGAILSERTKQVLEKAAGAGYEVVIASGRSYASLPPAVLEIRGIRYAVTSNGAAVYHVPSGRRVHEVPMDPEAVEALLRFSEKLCMDACWDACWEQVRHEFPERARSRSMALEVFLDGVPYADGDYVKSPTAFGASKEAVPYVQSTRTPVTPMDDFVRAHIRELDSLDLIMPSEPVRNLAMERLDREVPKIYATSSVASLIEISHENGGKHRGLMYVLETEGIDASEVIAFGDAENDIDLLKMAGKGVAMENASAGCKEAADDVTLTNNEDGVAVYLEKLLHLA